MPILLRGAMRVTVSMPCLVGRWPILALGILGAGNTCLLRDSASTSENSMRLFFAWCLRALKQALSDPETGIAVGMIAYLALWTDDQGCAGGIARFWLSLVVANDSGVAAMAFSARIARIHPAGDDAACMPGFVLCVAENAPFHPE